MRHDTHAQPKRQSQHDDARTFPIRSRHVKHVAHNRRSSMGKCPRSDLLFRTTLSTPRYPIRHRTQRTSSSRFLTLHGTDGSSSAPPSPPPPTPPTPHQSPNLYPPLNPTTGSSTLSPNALSLSRPRTYGNFSF